ncbi:MAG: NYN domain-containing protein [Candidatus Edwardsbacteria bacterium]|nr:NYN domain-containing protein [Candidatus Edwardsbacteria bacterium]MBU1576076.1 NYN domain-containing protein [Candidatus Edwardsbacteria bacterium]MBU2463678.1 NYN domain-containing protein [Candidatus Edwardsbacteria bacterium]MBU2594146.1 NYN domain-containing protein [Candidatus Edwardsbacteria bacterium]
MIQEPEIKRAITFFDAQNLYRCAKAAFGYHFPNYDPIKLSTTICSMKKWHLQEVRFYTGVPSVEDDLLWHHFWTSKLSALKRRGAKTYSRYLQYHEETIKIPDYGDYKHRIGKEKGIDIRIAIETIRIFRENKADVIIIFSQDQDFIEIIDEIKSIALEHNRWYKIVSAFPDNPVSNYRNGINNTEWFPITKDIYDQCIDPGDYRPRSFKR